jgi:hypothetical protein
MSALVSTIEIGRSPDEVFSYATDPAHFADWQPDVVEARAEGAGPLGVGSRLTQTRRIGRAQRSFSQEVIEHDPPTSWAVRGTDGPIRPGMDLTWSRSEMAAVHVSPSRWTSIRAGSAACWCRWSYGDWRARTPHTAIRTSRNCSKAATGPPDFT